MCCLYVFLCVSACLFVDSCAVAPRRRDATAHEIELMCVLLCRSLSSYFFVYSVYFYLCLFLFLALYFAVVFSICLFLSVFRLAFVGLCAVTSPCHEATRNPWKNIHKCQSMQTSKHSKFNFFGASFLIKESV